MSSQVFRSSFSETIFKEKYAHEGAESWPELCSTLVEDVCRNFISKDDKAQLLNYMVSMKFIPGGRYLYYAGRPIKAFNNCYLLRSIEDTREDWADLSWKAESCLISGGGIGNDYSVYRAKGSELKRTGGMASGPISKMKMTNEMGREIMQGNGRRSAIYASLNWQHHDVNEFLTAKDWHHLTIPGTDITYFDAKQADYRFPAPLDMTNISVNYDTDWLMHYWNTGDYGSIFEKNCHQALMTGEPGFSFNFFDKERETLRNACTEVTSEDDSDVCNLGSINLGRIDDINELISVVSLASMFLLCGTLVADLPYEKVYTIREKNRRLGLGLMGVHEWLIKKGYKYSVPDELHTWLQIYSRVSETAAKQLASTLGVSTPVAYRAIAPTGTIGILAGTTTGIEPVYAVAYRRRYLSRGKRWKSQFVVDATANNLIEQYGVSPDKIESAIDLASDYKRRIAVQADIQDYVDMSISSTINLPAWGTELNNEDTVKKFAKVLAHYAPRLRGFTCYPDGSRGGQPLEPVDYAEAVEKIGTEYDEHIEVHDVCDITGKGGSCGI